MCLTVKQKQCDSYSVCWGSWSIVLPLISMQIGREETISALLLDHSKVYWHGLNITNYSVIYISTSAIISSFE